MFSRSPPPTPPPPQAPEGKSPKVCFCPYLIPGPHHGFPSPRPAIPVIQLLLHLQPGKWVQNRSSNNQPKERGTSLVKSKSQQEGGGSGGKKSEGKAMLWAGTHLGLGMAVVGGGRVKGWKELAQPFGASAPMLTSEASRCGHERVLSGIHSSPYTLGAQREKEGAMEGRFRLPLARVHTRAHRRSGWLSAGECERGRV